MSLPASDYISIEGIILSIITLNERRKFKSFILFDASSLKIYICKNPNMNKNYLVVTDHFYLLSGAFGIF